MKIDLERSRSSALLLFMRGDPPPYKEIILPGNATIRIGDHEVFIPQGAEKAVGPVDSFDYELISWAPTVLPRPWRWKR